jgi:hypothetical protein
MSELMLWELRVLTPAEKAVEVKMQSQSEDLR